eukprot:607721-Amphidinium_carterae.1
MQIPPKGKFSGWKTSAPQGPPPKKSSAPPPCKYFQEGRCKFGDSCKFSHSKGKFPSKPQGPPPPVKPKSKDNAPKPPPPKAGAAKNAEESKAASKPKSIVAASLLEWAMGKGESEESGDRVVGETSSLELTAGNVVECFSTEPVDVTKPPLLDTGATSFLRDLGKLSEEGALNAQKVYIKVAVGPHKRALVANGIVYAHQVSRELMPVGLVRQALGVMNQWVGESPTFFIKKGSSVRVLELFQAELDGPLPV